MAQDAQPFSYRPHLDGLRAVAVVLVFVFHANNVFLQGGFIGVDIFFVLSGYLITRVLLTRIERNGKLDFADFYARRARRLLPAMILVATTVAVREVLWGSILDAAARAREVASTLLYVANWNFISAADDYFAAEGGASPLRHVWSLAVEEQFYIVFPLLLLGVLVLGRRRWQITPLILGGLATVSVVLMAVLYSPLNVVRTYYGTDTRAHQLLIGVLLGYLFHRLWGDKGPEASGNKRILALVGVVSLVGLLAISVVITGSGPFYSRGGSLLVALIAAGLIAAMEMAPDSPVARVLSYRPVVGLGLMSYGFYLWHWPIILWLTPPVGASFLERRVVNFAQFALAIAVSYASYRLLEMPIRKRRGVFASWSARRTVAVGLSASLAGAAVLGFMVLPRDIATPSVAVSPELGDAGAFTEPEPSVPSPDLSSTREEPGVGDEPMSVADRDALAVAAAADRSYEPCPDNPRPCVKYEPSSDPSIPTVALIGDSTAQAYDPALKLLAEEYGFRYVQAAVGGCPISRRLLATGGDGELHKPSNYMCFEELPKIYSEVLDTWDPELFIATSWNETNQHVENGVLIEAGTPQHHDAVESGLRDVVEQLTTRANLVFVDVLPGGPSVTCLDDSDPTDPRCNREVRSDSREKGYNAIFALLASEYGRVSSIGLTDVVCPDDVCPLMLKGVVVRYDGGHFTATASRMLAPLLDGRLRAAGVDLSDVAALR